MNETNGNEVSVKIKTYAEDTDRSLKKLTNTLQLISFQIGAITENMNKLTSSTNKAENELKKTKSELSKLADASSKLKTSFNTAFNLGRLYLVWNVTKRIRDAMTKLIQSSIDYIETQNLFDVSMNRQQQKAYKFMNTMAETFGVARTELMNYQASFNNVLKSLPRFN